MRNAAWSRNHNKITQVHTCTYTHTSKGCSGFSICTLPLCAPTSEERKDMCKCCRSCARLSDRPAQERGGTVHHVHVKMNSERERGCERKKRVL